MLKKLIIIENGKEVQCDTIQDVAKALIDENYYSITDEEKKKKMEMKALANTINNKMEIVEKVKDNDIEGKFVIKNEITYILSLLITNNIILLERMDSNVFTKSINKKNMNGNYIIVNKFAKNILKEEIKIQ